jgi:hypothetical protein
MLCFHKWGEIKDNRQRCTKCGLYRTVECNHGWKTMSTKTLRYTATGTCIGEFVKQKCIRCGEIKSVTLMIK